ncbi:unnamed protein product [Brassicogethes aeneus]|uniref:Androgen-dependent TFPI-regulating protein n=1 Tax=Brassicogethes aeneus TaxID=1431903 RepID=A0A9P0BAW8_BRAAE|nr:unnamed protein product [Brassicogethes aeneus]
MLKNYVPKHVVAMVIYIPLVAFYIYSIMFRRGLRLLGKTDPAFQVTEEVRALAKFGPFFFTSWNFGLQIVFMSVAILDALAMLLNLPVTMQKFLGRTRSGMFNGLVVPATLLVSSIFWFLYNYERKLIYPDSVEKVLPSWLNHTLHTLIVLPVLIEFLLPKQYNFVKFSHAFKLLTTYLIVYEIGFYYIYFTENIFLYPIFTRLNWTMRFVFSMLVYGLGCFYTALGILIQGWKKSSDNKRRKKLP